MHRALDYTISVLGCSAVEISFGNSIDPALHKQVMALYQSLNTYPVSQQIDLIPAYCSLTVVCDPQRLVSAGLAELITELQKRLDTLTIKDVNESPLLQIPVCYDECCAPDLEAVSRQCRLSSEEVIALHTQTEYTVFMLGFLPGFPYMGVLPYPLQLPRKEEPVIVKQGMIAIAGSQTGIYPQTSPGGWWQIGQTPLSLFNVDMHQPCLFAPGDRVRFYAIDKEEFEEIRSVAVSVNRMTLLKKGGCL